MSLLNWFISVGICGLGWWSRHSKDDIKVLVDCLSTAEGTLQKNQWRCSKIRGQNSERERENASVEKGWASWGMCECCPLEQFCCRFRSVLPLVLWKCLRQGCWWRHPCLYLRDSLWIIEFSLLRNLWKLFPSLVGLTWIPSGEYIISSSQISLPCCFFLASVGFPILWRMGVLSEGDPARLVLEIRLPLMSDLFGSAR